MWNIVHITEHLRACAGYVILLRKVGAFMLVGISTHVHVYKPLDRKLLSRIKSAGFETVELYANPPHWADYDRPSRRRELAEICMDLDLPINSVHAPFFRRLEEARAGRWLSLTSKDPEVRRESVERTAECMAVAEYAPVDCVVVHVGAPSEEEDGGTFDRLFYSLEDLIKPAQELNIKPALENITNTFSSGDRLREFVTLSGLPGIGCCYDCGHAEIRDRLVEEFEIVAEHLLTTHIHDTTDGLDNHLLPFEGEIDWEALAGAFAKTDYDGALILEAKDDSGAVESIAASYEAACRLRDMIYSFSER